MKQSKAQELLDVAVTRLGTLKAVCDITNMHKSALIRIKTGKTKRPHHSTVGKLLDAAYGE